MPKIQMIAQVSGTRDGGDWPLAGGVLEVSAIEAADLVRAGLAKPYEGAPEPEKAVARKPETRKGGLTKDSMR